MRKRWVIALVCLLSLFCGGMGLALVDKPLEAIGAPFFYGSDFASEIHLLKTGRMFWAEGRHVTGYNPWFMAGYPYADYTSGVVWKLLGIAFRSLNAGTIAAIILVGPLFLFPLAGYISLKFLDRSEAEALAGSFLAACLGILGPPLYLTWMGLGESAAAIGLSLVAAALLFRFNTKGGLANFAALLLALFLSFMVHKTSMVALFIVGTGIVIFGGVRKYRVVMSGFAGVAASAANLFWILPLWRNRRYLDFVPHYHWGASETLIPFGDFFKLTGMVGSLPLAWTLLIGSLVGWRMLRRTDRKAADAWLGAQMLLAAFAYIGPYVGWLVPAQPRRFVAYFLVLGVYPASVAFHRAIMLLDKRARLLATAAFTCLVFLLPNAYLRVAPFKIMTSLPPRAEAVTEWIATNTTPDARVMVEEIGDAGRPDNPYGGSYLNALLPPLTGREIIGGPYPGIDIIHHRVTLVDGKLLKKPLSAVSDRELARILDLYNIGWVVAFSAEAKARFSKAGGIIEKVAEFEPIYCYKVDGKKSFVMGGKARVHARANVIEVKVTRVEGNSIVVKYHWDPHLKADHGVKLDRFNVPEDPVGFIRAWMESPGEFTIVYKY